MLTLYTSIMPFCYSPWTNIDISPSGGMTPCCKFRSESYSEKFNIQSHTIKEYSQSKLIQEIKQDFAQNKWPAGCERCRIEEENSIKSKRNLDYSRWYDLYNKYNLHNDGFITASVAFGNTCNLKCITCGPVASSRWQKEYQDLYGQNIVPYKFYKKDFVSEFINSAPHMMHIDIPGGEPFLSGVAEQKDLLAHYIQTDQAKNMTLHYTTNATIFPELEWWDLWHHFKEVDLQLSIDGIGQRYEYLRYPAVWNDTVDNVKKYIHKEQEYANIKLSVSHTVSAYNIYYLDEFFSWCQEIRLPTPWLGKVHTPMHMRPGVWPNLVRDKIIDKLQASKFEDVKTWSRLLSNIDDSDFFDLFKSKTQQHDEYRQLDFSKTFPDYELI